MARGERVRSGRRMGRAQRNPSRWSTRDNDRFRCALPILLVQMSNSSSLSSSAKADDPLFQRQPCLSREAAGYWMPAFAVMTVECGDMSSRSRDALRPSFASLSTLLDSRGRRESRVRLHPWVLCNKEHGVRSNDIDQAKGGQNEYTSNLGATKQGGSHDFSTEASFFFGLGHRNSSVPDRADGP